MTTSLLVTKLFIPPTRLELVPRPRLIERLDTGLSGRLILISTPAGFGKTTLLTQWLDNLNNHPGRDVQIEYKIAWYSIDAGDNDLSRFLTYLVTTLNRVEGISKNIGVGALSMLQSPQPPPAEVVLTSLINEIASVPDSFLLVLDDYHLIDAQPIHDALEFLLENLPPQIHLVIATREDPPLPLSRFRARGQLTELRAADLRFTPAEAAEFLNQVMGLELTEENIQALEARTEGWIAGLQLAAISMRGHQDAAGFIKSFTGSHRLVLDYLIEEVLDRQSESDQLFLLQTAILDRLTAGLCDAVTGRKDSRQVLDMVEHANLFIIPLDDERQWYRYHHLFADLLQRRLQQALPDQSPVLQQRASEWFQANGYFDEAIVHILRARKYDRAAELLNDQADALWQRGEHGKLRAWLEVVPNEFILSKPLLSIYRAYYLYSSGENDQGGRLLEEVEKSVYLEDEGTGDVSEKLSKDELEKLLGRYELIRALICSFTGDVPGMIKHSNQALEYLPAGDFSWRSMAALTLGDAYSYLGDMNASYRARAESLQACEETGDAYYSIVAGLKFAATLKEQGKFHQTSQLCQEKLQLAEDYGFSQSGPVGCLKALWGDVLAELNDLESALLEAREGVKLTERGGNLTILGYSYHYLIRVLISKQDLAGAEEIIKSVVQLSQKTVVPPWLMNLKDNWQARLCLERGDTEAASQWVAKRSIDSSNIPEKFDYLLLFDYLILARILIAQNEINEATGLLRQLEQTAVESGRTTSLIEILLLQALANQDGGKTSDAMISLDQALNLAEPLGYFRIFVDEGLPMRRLLQEAYHQNITPHYIRRLLEAFHEGETGKIDAKNLQTTTSELVEPLSERELEVLELIAQGMTNPEIAARLYLSPHTVKVHTRNIYGKLGTHNRIESVTRARDLEILPSA